MNYEQLWGLLLGNVSIVFLVITTLAALVLSYAQAHKPRWRKYSCRRLPYARIFRSGEYGYDTKTFLSDVSSAVIVLRKLGEWYQDKKPLLLVGPTGIGKSRLVTQFLGNLGFPRRLWQKVLMPTPDELVNKNPPLFCQSTVLFLNDLHEYRDVADLRLSTYLMDKRFSVVATIPSEKYDPNWQVLSRFAWNQCKIELWSESDGRRLADARGKEFSSSTFRGTPLSVLAPSAEMKRSYELLPSDRKAVLKSLKIAKVFLGCFTEFNLISSVSDLSVSYHAFVDVISHGYWCRTYASRAILADGIEDSIDYDVQIQDAYKLQYLLSEKEPPLTNASEYLFYLGNQFNRLEEPSRALNCYDRSLELKQFRETLLNEKLLREEIERRRPETRGKAMFAMEKRPGTIMHVWPTDVPPWLSRIMDANGMPLESVLTQATANLTFAIKETISKSSQRADQVEKLDKSDRENNWKTIAIYLPPGFMLPHGYQNAQVESQYAGIRIVTAPPCDRYGPSWRVIYVTRDAFNSGATMSLSQISPLQAKLFAFPQALLDKQAIKATTDGKCYYVRINGLTAPDVAGRYFIKLALLDQEPSGNVEFGAMTTATEPHPRFVPLQNCASLLVLGEVCPATITGVLLNANYDLTVKRPISETGKVWAHMTMRVDPYTGHQRPDLPKIDAICYFNSTAYGKYKLEGVAPGIYDLYASAAGFPQVLIGSSVSVSKGQSLRADGYLRPGVVIRGKVFSKIRQEDAPWSDTKCVNIELFSGPTLSHKPDPSAGLISWSPSHWTCRGKHNLQDGLDDSSDYYRSLGGHSHSKVSETSVFRQTLSDHQITDKPLIEGVQDLDSVQNWQVQAGATQPFSFEFGIKDKCGASRDFDGMVPQVDAAWVNGLSPSRYYVRAWVRGYDQSAADSSTFVEYWFDVLPRQEVREIDLKITLRPRNHDWST